MARGLVVIATLVLLGSCSSRSRFLLPATGIWRSLRVGPSTSCYPGSWRPSAAGALWILSSAVTAAWLRQLDRLGYATAWRSAPSGRDPRTQDAIDALR
jgi:hypothetical protein